MAELENSGAFVISLDFELHWGVSEHRTVESYHENLINTPLVVNELLNLFTEQDIRATWATVGMLFAKNKNELLTTAEHNFKPTYENTKLSNYKLLTSIGENSSDDPFHYASELILKINNTVGQEVGSHSYSHYYCLEKGQELDEFSHDLKLYKQQAQSYGIESSSFVFPRNQYSRIHLKELQKLGFKTFRGSEQSWLYAPRSREKETKVRKLLRLIDAYFKISGDNTHVEGTMEEIVNIPSSRFLRPYDARLKFLESLRLSRIKNEMTFAAKNNKIYHLWWHPHNFGKYKNKNFEFLENILRHFKHLENIYDFKSRCMSDFVRRVNV